jgi:plastocyanin
MEPTVTMEPMESMDHSAMETTESTVAPTKAPIIKPTTKPTAKPTTRPFTAPTKKPAAPPEVKKYNVAIQTFAYSPSSLNIAVNDEVYCEPHPFMNAIIIVK